MLSIVGHVYINHKLNDGKAATGDSGPRGLC